MNKTRHANRYRLSFTLFVCRPPRTPPPPPPPPHPPPPPSPPPPPPPPLEARQQRRSGNAPPAPLAGQTTGMANQTRGSIQEVREGEIQVTRPTKLRHREDRAIRARNETMARSTWPPITRARTGALNKKKTPVSRQIGRRLVSAIPKFESYDATGSTSAARQADRI